MKTVRSHTTKKESKTTTRLSLDRDPDIILFPEKLEQANQVLRTVQLPENKNSIG